MHNRNPPEMLHAKDPRRILEDTPENIQDYNEVLKKTKGKKLIIKRSIFQTFWRLHCCPKFLFFELETSNFGYLLIF